MSPIFEALQKAVQNSTLSLRKNGEPKQRCTWTRYNDGLTIKIEFNGTSLAGSITSTNPRHSLRELQRVDVVLEGREITYRCEIRDGLFGAASIEALNYRVSVSE